MSGPTPDVRSLHPAPDQYAHVFGGREPLLTVPPGTIVELSTEDCFAGKVRGVGDLPSQVCTFPFLNPVTGPIAVEGAEVGDTLAVHFVEIAPARDWAASGTFPHFGALTTTHQTAMLHPAYQLVSQAGLAPAGNVVDTSYTMVAKLPKSLLGSATAYDGLHARLRGVAADYLRTR